MIDESYYQRPEGVPERHGAGGVVARIARGLIYVALATVDAGYVLPKGGIEDGETIDEAAVREIEEEAGLTEVTKLDDLGLVERCSSSKRYWSITHFGLYVTNQIRGVVLDTDKHGEIEWFLLDALPEMVWPEQRRLIEDNRRRISESIVAHANPQRRKTGYV